MSVLIEEKQLPNKNYDNITIECSKFNQSQIVQKKACTNITGDLLCKCDSLEIATKYQVNIYTNKQNWTSRKLIMDDQYTSIKH